MSGGMKAMKRHKSVVADTVRIACIVAAVATTACQGDLPPDADFCPEQPWSGQCPIVSDRGGGGYGEPDTVAPDGMADVVVDVVYGQDAPVEVAYDQDVPVGSCDPFTWSGCPTGQACLKQADGVASCVPHGSTGLGGYCDSDTKTTCGRHSDGTPLTCVWWHHKCLRVCDPSNSGCPSGIWCAKEDDLFGYCIGDSSCKDRCGTWSQEAACNCDKACSSLRDCCDDLSKTCPSYVVGPEGAECAGGLYKEACYFENPYAVPRRLLCDPGTSKWQLIETCGAPGSQCTQSESGTTTCK